MSDAKFILVVNVGTAKTEYYTNDSDEYEHEFCRQVWAHRLEQIIVDKNIRAEIDKYNDGDEDFSSMVLFVLDAETHKILIDYTDYDKPNELNFMGEKEKKEYLDAHGRCRKDREQKEEYALRMLEAQLGELKEQTNINDI
jgi:hypothetical protein